MSYNFYGYNPTVSYCPKCGNNEYYDSDSDKHSKMYYNVVVGEVLVICLCGWRGAQTELLNKLSWERKNKLIKIKNYEN